MIERAAAERDGVTHLRLGRNDDGFENIKKTILCSGYYYYPALFRTRFPYCCARKENRIKPFIRDAIK